MTLNTYRLACLADAAMYRRQALANRANNLVFIYLAKVWLKRARLATRAINNRDPFKAKIQHGH